MFPRFDKACHSHPADFADDLHSVGFPDGPAAARLLQGICRLWWSHSGISQSPHDHPVPPRSDSAAAAVSGSPQLLPQISPAGAAPEDHSAERSAPVWYRNLERVLQEAPLRERVLTVVDQFVRNSIDPPDPFTLFEQTPRSLDVLARIACGSPFLTQTLLADPGSLAAVTARGRTAEMKSREQFIQEAEDAVSRHDQRTIRLQLLRRYQRRELLRIGMCDAFGLLDLRFVTLQLSLLADAMVQVCLNLAEYESGTSCDQIAVLALGKLGGEELNYSSDIDLILVATHDSPETRRLARLCIEGLTHDLNPGFLYRVDLRLRPWGDAGSLLSTPASLTDYLSRHAATWEKQAMLKARAVAGNPRLGRSALAAVRPLLFSGCAQTVRSEIQHMKERIESRLRQRGKLQSEVKLGVGSIRDIEFLVQYLQLTHGRQDPRILSCNTLESLARLAEFGMLNATWYRQLRAGYVFLRTVEHSLQLLHNQQTHELPHDAGPQEWLAQRLDFPDAATLLQRFAEHRSAVRSIFEACISSPDPQDRHRNPVSPAAMSRPQPNADRAADLVSPELPISVHCAPSAPDSRPLQVVVRGVEFSGWLAATCGLMAVHRLTACRVDVVTAGSTKPRDLNCPPGTFLATFEVCQPVGVTRDRLLSGCQKGSQPPETFATLSGSCPTPERLAGLLQIELTEILQRVRGGQSEAVQFDLIGKLSDASLPPDCVVADSTAVTLIRPRHVADGETAVEFRGHDAHALLFELVLVLSLSGFRVSRAMAESQADQVCGVMYVTEADGSPVSRPDRREELQTSATVIRQFAHWLPLTGDPARALLNFRELLTRLRLRSDWPRTLQSLQRPSVLHAAAQVLGISPFLWDDLLKLRHEELFPLIAHAEQLTERVAIPALAAELDSVLAGAESLTSPWSALNSFKDRQLFRIDLRHLLGRCHPFGEFSVEITELADLVVSRAVRLAWTQLVAEHGLPLGDSSGLPCPFAVAGLGKFGGVEMGFASDIELLLIYREAGQTAGANNISCARFFDALVNMVAAGISARQDGIFQVDLRMRPYGQAGSAAISLHDFDAYYHPNGAAWPYERQTLVRFRCVAGDTDFSRQATETCHRLLYTSGAFDFAAMRGMRERQIRQLVRGGTINVKLSDGGLVDCEYAMQALQLTFGKHLPELRQPNTLAALRVAGEVGLIDPLQCQRVQQAWVFLRQLIDCLRMVRGNARDLTLPDPGTPDHTQLVRRLKIVHQSRIPLSHLESQMAVIREFSFAVERHCKSLRSPAR